MEKQTESLASKISSSSGFKDMMAGPIMSNATAQVFRPNPNRVSMQSDPTLTEKTLSPKTPTTEINNDKKIEVDQSQPIKNIEENDTEFDILNKMFGFMQTEESWKNKKHEMEIEYNKKLENSKETKNKQLISLFTGKKIKKEKKPLVKKEKKVEKEKEFTAEKEVTKKEEPTILEKAKGVGEKVVTTAQKVITPKNIAIGAAAATGVAIVAGGATNLGNLIAKKGESGAAGYDAFNLGTKNNKIIGSKKKENLQDMTVGDIMARQSIQWGDPNEDQKLFAVGKYQMIPSTLADAVKTLGVGKNEKFTPELQERMFKEYLISAKRPAISKYLNSPTDDPDLLKNAVRQLSYEWASIADPDKGGTTSHYGSGNKAVISVDEISNVLRLDRENNMKQKGILEPNLVSTLNKPEIPTKIGGESGNKPKITAISTNNTNVFNGGTSYNITKEQQVNNSPLVDKQYYTQR